MSVHTVDSPRSRVGSWADEKQSEPVAAPHSPSRSAVAASPSGSSSDSDLDGAVVMQRVAESPSNSSVRTAASGSDDESEAEGAITMQRVSITPPLVPGSPVQMTASLSNITLAPAAATAKSTDTLAQATIAAVAEGETTGIESDDEDAAPAAPLSARVSWGKWAAVRLVVLVVAIVVLIFFYHITNTYIMPLMGSTPSGGGTTPGVGTTPTVGIPGFPTPGGTIGIPPGGTGGAGGAASNWMLNIGYTRQGT